MQFVYRGKFLERNSWEGDETHGFFAIITNYLDIQTGYYQSFEMAPRQDDTILMTKNLTKKIFFLKNKFFWDFPLQLRNFILNKNLSE